MTAADDGWPRTGHKPCPACGKRTWRADETLHDTIDGEHVPHRCVRLPTTTKANEPA